MREVGPLNPGATYYATLQKGNLLILLLGKELETLTSTSTSTCHTGTLNVATVSVNVTAPPGKGGGGSLGLLGILALAGLALWGPVFRSERRAKPAILAMRN